MKVLICSSCGAISQATDENDKPVCVICEGISDYTLEEKEVPDNLVVKCECGKTLTYKGGKWYYANGNESGYEEPPFLNLQSERFYCGCYGWD